MDSAPPSTAIGGSTTHHTSSSRRNVISSTISSFDIVAPVASLPIIMGSRPHCANRSGPGRRALIVIPLGSGNGMTNVSAAVSALLRHSSALFTVLCPFFLFVRAAEN